MRRNKNDFYAIKLSYESNRKSAFHLTNSLFASKIEEEKMTQK